MYWDKEVKLENFQNMITVYEKHIEELEQENRSLKMQVDFLKEQLAYKTFGKPNNEEKVSGETQDYTTTNKKSFSMMKR